MNNPKTTLLEMKEITKRFGSATANENVNFSTYSGEIHALVGENGAGKTTLMNILYGLYQPDEGEIYLRDSLAHIRDPRQAIGLGIGMVHQHFMLVPPLTVTENIILGSEPQRGLFLDLAGAETQVTNLSKQFGLAVEPKAKIEEISVGMEQRVEILKILYRNADLLIFDEPTAVLTPQETKELFQIFRNLKQNGKSIIFITHKLQEVLEITDRITVMRQGKVTGTLSTKEATKEDIARLMVGRDVVLKVDKTTSKPGKTILSVDNLSAKNDRGLPALRNVSLEVRAGEILGIAGVAGNGQTELAEVITNLRHKTGGEICINGTFSHIPEDRHKRGLILDYSVAENSILGRHHSPSFTSKGLLQFEKISRFARNLISQYDVRTPDQITPVRALSGGNQQKVIIGREFSKDPDILVISQPTRGVDVGAIEFIHKQIIAKRNEGKAILLISMELDEILSLSDRVAVMYEGQIVATLDAAITNEEELGLLMAGIRS